MMALRFLNTALVIAMVSVGCSMLHAKDGVAVSDGDSRFTDGWDMKAYPFVTVNRIPQWPDMDSAQMDLTMAGHLAHLDLQSNAGIMRLVGQFVDEWALRGFALLDVADSATAMAHMSVGPSVRAGIFSLDSRLWWGPAFIDISGAAAH